ncbi:MAG: hypothetical protein K8H85_03510 [Cyclobacteriaceae bacterium]|jgi:hypothetical protein|nr:hypothetical protein [Cyclobacteriaceae bacterium]
MRLAFVIFILCYQSAFSQKTGEVDYPYLGIKFTIPPQWKGGESGDGFLIISDTQPGLIFMVPHDVNDLDILKREAEAGLQEEGVVLQKTGGFDEVGKGGVGAEFEGIIQGQSAKAYVVGIINPFGNGVSIISATTTEMYTDVYKKLAQQIAMSIQFSEPIEAPVTQEWRDALKGAKLTYMNSDYSSGGVSVGGYSTYSGYSSHSEITLCANGYFSYYSSDSFSVDTGGGFANSAGNNNGQGNWEVTSSGNGEPVLKLLFNNGKTHSYQLSYKDKKTYLNDTRYFRTYDAKCN